MGEFKLGCGMNDLKAQSRCMVGLHRGKDSLQVHDFLQWAHTEIGTLSSSKWCCGTRGLCDWFGRWEEGGDGRDGRRVGMEEMGGGWGWKRWEEGGDGREEKQDKKYSRAHLHVTRNAYASLSILPVKCTC